MRTFLRSRAVLTRRLSDETLVRAADVPLDRRLLEGAFFPALEFKGQGMGQAFHDQQDKARAEMLAGPASIRLLGFDGGDGHEGARVRAVDRGGSGEQRGEQIPFEQVLVDHAVKMEERGLFPADQGKGTLDQIGAVLEFLIDPHQGRGIALVEALDRRISGVRALGLVLFLPASPAKVISHPP